VGETIMTEIQLKNRHIFEGMLVNETTFRIGATELEEVSNENPILLIELKNGEKKPIIPASSLKGLFRSEFERIIQVTKKNTTNTTICTKDSPIITQAKNKPSHECPVCRLFGSQERKGCLKIQDAILQDENPSISVRTKITINRKTRTNLKRGLAFFELIEPKSQFNFYARLENIDENSEEMKIFTFILKELQSGRIRIGGQKSSGMGIFTIQNLKVRRMQINKPEDLKTLGEEMDFDDFYSLIHAK